MISNCDNYVKEASNFFLYFLEENRRKTFKKWVFSDTAVCNAGKMAEAGFIFTGNSAEPDAVCCFFCGKSLDGWEETDNPWLEHLKHAPKCKFAKLQKSQDSLTLQQYFELRLDLKKHVIEYSYNKYKDSIIKHIDHNAIRKVKKMN